MKPIEVTKEQFEEAIKGYTYYSEYGNLPAFEYSDGEGIIGEKKAVSNSVTYRNDTTKVERNTGWAYFLYREDKDTRIRRLEKELVEAQVEIAKLKEERPISVKVRPIGCLDEFTLHNKSYRHHVLYPFKFEVTIKSDDGFEHVFRETEI